MNIDEYKKNAAGHLVPVEQIEEIDLLRDEFVVRLVEQAKQQSETTQAFKKTIVDDFNAFLDLSAEKYGVIISEKQSNISLSSFDGKYKVLRQIAVRIEFDERLQAAKELIDRCLREWTKTADPNIRALINDAFQVDKKGQVNTQRILGLRRLKIEHPTWEKAMEAISASIEITGSCAYYRFYIRDDRGKYKQVLLDFSVI